MKNLAVLLIALLAAIAPAFGANPDSGGLQLAQATTPASAAQKQAQKQAAKSGQKQTTARHRTPAPDAEKPGPSCDRDGRWVPDKETWCVKKTMRRCNASNGQWIDTGVRCG